MKINIVGGGFVGLTLAEVLSTQNSIEKITVIDVDKDKLERIKSGDMPVKEPGIKLDSDKLSFTTDYNEADGNIFFVCVGTPNDLDGVQDCSYLEDAFTKISKACKNPVVILKSTTLPENVMELKTVLDPVRSIFITNPEFLAEGNAVEDLKNQFQLIVGSEDRDREYAMKIMEEIFEGTYKKICGVGLREAMVIKYFLNCYKAQKLNFYNSFNRYCQCSGIKFSEVLESVNDPVLGEGFNKPGVGFGGSCFPKDSLAMSRNINVCGIIHDVNELLIKEFTHDLRAYLNNCNNPIVLIGGKAFKNGTNDTRDSVAIKVVKGLRVKNIYYYDREAELSDMTLDEVKKYKNRFTHVILFNELPELIEVFEDTNVELINTRQVQ